MPCCWNKTGTLTLGKPSVTDIIAAAGYSRDEVLRLAAFSRKKFGTLTGGKPSLKPPPKRNWHFFTTSQFSAMPGLGIEAGVDGKQIVLGNLKLLKRKN